MNTEIDIGEAAAEALMESTAKLRIREKWGSAVSGGGLTGFLALPEVLIRCQHRLGLTSTEMMVLINVLMHWWYPDRKPFPGNYAIANRMGVSRRTVQRAIKSIEAKGLISTNVRVFTEDDRGSVADFLDDDVEDDEILTTPYEGVRLIDLSGLVLRLQECVVDLKDYNARGDTIE